MSVIDIQKAFFDFFKTPDINQGVQEYKAIPGAVFKLTGPDPSTDEK